MGGATVAATTLVRQSDGRSGWRRQSSNRHYFAGASGSVASRLLTFREIRLLLGECCAYCMPSQQVVARSIRAGRADF